MKLNRLSFGVFVCVLGVVTCSLGCARKRSLQEIEAEKRELPYLYLTAVSGKEVLAPGSAGIFVDEQTGELAYPAYVCRHPNCPGRQGEEDHLFIHFNPLYKSVGGELVLSDFPEDQDPIMFLREQGAFIDPTCPSCIENRDLDSETPEESQAYVLAVEPYIPASTLKRAAELEEEYQRRFKEEQTIRKEGYR